MRQNSRLIRQSDLLATLVEKIERSHPDDISLLVCYGSFVTGDYSELSDIDFFFVPGTDRGSALQHQFIINRIGYDLWPVSWEKLDRISRLEDHPASILMDGKVLFASSAADLARLEGLQKALEQNLKSEPVIRKVSAQHIERAKTAFYDLQTCESGLLVSAVKITETLLEAIALMNGAYLQKGLKKIENELSAMAAVPPGFLKNYQHLIHTGQKPALLRMIDTMIRETDALWKQKFEQEQGRADPSELAGFYEEFKSTYNKLLRACDQHNYESAYYAAFMADRETGAFLSGFAVGSPFPALMEAILSNDFDAVRTACLNHEEQLLKVLRNHNIEINVYSDFQDFEHRFLGKPPG